MFELFKFKVYFPPPNETFIVLLQVQVGMYGWPLSLAVIAKKGPFTGF